jgi:hypothetical protein
LTRLHRKLINIRRRSRISMNNSHQPLHQIVKEQRKKEATAQLQEMEQQVSIAAELLDKAAQLWTRLEEDPQVQRWDKEEERINTTIQELKQRQKTIPIPERVKGKQEMKKM